MRASELVEKLTLVAQMLLKLSNMYTVVFFVQMQHKAAGVASLAEDAAVPLMQCPLLGFRAGTCSLVGVPAIAHLLFTKDTLDL